MNTVLVLTTIIVLLLIFLIIVLTRIYALNKKLKCGINLLLQMI